MKMKVFLAGPSAIRKTLIAPFAAELEKLGLESGLLRVEKIRSKPKRFSVELHPGRDNDFLKSIPEGADKNYD